MGEEKTYDVAVIGGGHNGLVCACYLAKAGLSVVVLERRHIVGGAVCTQDDLIAGYKIDVGSSAHIMIHLTPVVAELELEKFGLEYIDCDPFAFAPTREGEPLYFWRDVEKTCDSIARISPRDAENYRRFVREWGALNEGVFEAFLKPPTLVNLGRHMIFRRNREQKNPLEMTRKLFTNYGALARETFENESLRAALVWLAAQSGPPPSAAATGDFLGWHSMIHRSGVKRPRGGSGALTQALARCLEHHGGVVRLSSEVERIEVRGKRAGAIKLKGGESVEARRIVSNAHVQTTFLKLIGAENLPGELAKRVASVRVGNGFGMVVRCAVSELPDYTVAPSGGAARECHQGLQLLCPSTAYLERAYGDYLNGRPSERPAALAMTFSAVDPTLAPAGRHTLFIWGQYYPYELAGGARWDDIAGREADKLIDAVTEYAPNVRDSVIERYVQTPLDLERTLGLLRGNVMHVEMEFDQMFLYRPLPELATYRTPFENLYLTGASTHPGGGVFAASGRNTAHVVLADMHGKGFSKWFKRKQ
ncbi:MAG TPA: NAD(P)/FAD-dependent oxidoreductase [Pyrinomonadaceae bacterium]|jgi:phytoene desaturase|nr:NAD(P)/FAD-dependent oxidoreductase [Pyrinomonadaceae bacterium]